MSDSSQRPTDGADRRTFFRDLRERNERRIRFAQQKEAQRLRRVKIDRVLQAQRRFRHAG